MSEVSQKQSSPKKPMILGVPAVQIKNRNGEWETVLTTGGVFINTHYSKTAPSMIIEFKRLGGNTYKNTFWTPLGAQIDIKLIHAPGLDGSIVSELYRYCKVESVTESFAENYPETISYKFTSPYRPEILQ